MGQNFIADTVDQTLLFPPSLHDWLPEGHLARFLLDVVSALDLSAIYKSYQDKDGRGQAAYAPEMMVRLLLYGYARGVYSSRKIQTRTFEDVAFRYLSGDQHPGHATIAEFRKRPLEALSGLFTQALLLCSEAGLVKLGHVSIDGTKIKANAGKHKAMSYKHMNETEARLKQEIEALLAAAEKTDAEEDAQYGMGRHVTFQVMRRTLGTDLQEHGTLKDAQGALRHASIQTTGDVYMQTIEASVLHAMNSRTTQILAGWEHPGTTGSEIAEQENHVPKARRLSSGVPQQLDQVGPSTGGREAVSY
jgi:transposase